MTYEDRISIPTPEGVELELVLAGVGSRLVATLADFVVKGVILLALWIVGDALGGEGFVVALLVVGSFLVWFGYDVAFETLASGRTPGKRAAGAPGRPPRRRTGGVPGLGGAQPPAARRQPARHLRRRRRVHPLQPPQPAPRRPRRRHPRRTGAPGAAPGGGLPISDFGVRDFAAADRYAAWDVSGVTSFELVTVRRFLERRWQLDPGARSRLGWELAERLRPKVAGAPPDLHPEQFLEALAEAKASRG